MIGATTPQCGNCYETRRRFCQELFRGTAEVENVFAEEVANSTFATLLEMEAFETTQAHGNLFNGLLHKSLGRIGCELTLDEVEERIISVRQLSDVIKSS